MEFFQIGIFTIGGGYAALPLIKQHIVELKGYLTIQEFIDIITIAESTPGPIAINSATFVGVKTAGILGGIVCTFGMVAPSLIIVLFLGSLYHKYKEMGGLKTVLRVIRPVTMALISTAAITIIILAFFGSETLDFSKFDFLVFGLFIVGLFVIRKFKLNPIWIMLGSGVCGLVFYLLF